MYDEDIISMVFKFSVAILVFIFFINIFMSMASPILKVFGLPIKITTEQIDSASEIAEKTYDSTNAIYNYEWFKERYEKIKAVQNQIKIQNSSMNDFKKTYGNSSRWGYSEKQEYSRLLQIRTGLLLQQENLVAEYNARSKMANRKIFNDSLPFFVDKILW